MGSKKLFNTISRAFPDMELTTEQAKGFKSEYFRQFPNIREFMWRIEALVKERAIRSPERVGWVNGKSGRKYFCEADKAYRILNYLVQGESAMFFKRKMIEVHALLADKKTRLSNVIHDEFIFDLHNEEEALMPEIVRTIEDLSSYRVPIYANAAISSSCWSAKKEIAMSSALPAAEQQPLVP